MVLMLMMSLMDDGCEEIPWRVEFVGGRGGRRLVSLAGGRCTAPGGCGLEEGGGGLVGCSLVGL